MSKLNWLLAAVPVAVAAEWLHAPALVVFALSALAILPLSALLGRGTEELSAGLGPLLAVCSTPRWATWPSSSLPGLRCGPA